jgi:2-desacetyl-2-hydroxyethyl bacteriochlorophyllide A dehydrogenase
MPQGSRAVMPRPYELTVETYEVPAPGPGQLLVETEASGISPGTELAVYTGVHQWLNDPTRTWPRFPFCPGYSAVGRVAAVGEGVEGYAVGDRLVWPGRHESHALLKPGDPNAAIWRIAESVPAPVAALALITRFPLTALVRAEQMLGQSVAVMGLGTIGQITLRLFSAAGAYPLIGVDPQGGRRVVAERTAGVATVDPSEGDLKAKLRAVNGGALPDIVVDATGVPNVVRAAMSSVVDGGKVIMVGSPRGIAGEVDFYWDLHGRSISLIGAHGSAIGNEPREKFPFVRDRALRTIVHFLESGKLKIDDLITHNVHGAEAKAMYDGLLNQRDDFLAVTIHW